MDPWLVVAGGGAAIAALGALFLSRREALPRARCGGCDRVLLPTWDRCRFCGWRPASRRPRLEFTAGPLRGQVVEICGVTSLGSVSGNDVVLADPAVSRTHFVIRPDDHGFVIIDERSSNGVFVNGVRRRRARLDSGDTLRAGHSEMTFRVER